MNPLVAEFLGTMILILIGCGVNANASLKGTYGNTGPDWLQISVGWALAVYVGVICSQAASGAHLNPAVTIGLAVAGQLADFSWGQMMGYVVAQFAGAFAGAALVYAHYMQHFRITENADAKLGTFCTAPAIRGIGNSLVSEAVGTFVLVFAVLMTAGAQLDFTGGVVHKIGLGAVGALPVALIVFAIGIALGGTTGYAINPARDFSPRLAHALLPIPNKRDSDWGYAWVPIVGPILGGVAAGLLYLAVAAG